jgi:hypothetical protein
MPDSNDVYQPAPRVAFRTIDGEVVIVHPVENKLLTLNPTGSAIWERLTGRSLAEIAAELEGLFEVPLERAMADTITFVQEMERRGLVTRTSQATG